MRRRGSRDNELGALVIEFEPDLLEADASHGGAEFGFVVGVKEEEAAAAGADEFAAEGAIGHGEIVCVVDGGIAHAAGALFLALPVDVHEAGEFVEVAGFEGVVALDAELFDEVKDC